MMSSGQRAIIRDICDIQKNSLVRIISESDLGKYSDGEGSSIQELLDDLGLERKDFDTELFGNAERMDQIINDPDNILDYLDDLDLVVFKYILHNFRSRWEYDFPKALANLWDKIFVWELYHFKS